MTADNRGYDSERTMPQPITILLSGAPGAGKSTIQRRAPGYFRTRLGATAALGTDEIYTLVDPDWSMADETWHQIARDNCILLAKSFFQHGFRLVVIAGNALYTRSNVNEYLAALLPISAIYHFTLDAHLDAVVERVRARGDLDTHSPDWLASWLDQIRSHYAHWTQLIDTSDLTVEQTLDTIYTHIRLQHGRLTELID